MDKYQAEKIVEKYGGAIADSEIGIARRKSQLPCCKAKIRLAFYVYISSYIKEFGRLPKDLGEKLVVTYSMLDAFIEDDRADYVNKIGQMIKNKTLDKDDPNDIGKINDYFNFAHNLHNRNYVDEINEYISECYKEKGL
jgi:hypothetical protein